MSPDHHIYSIEPDGTGFTQLTTTVDLQPSWSADGKRIVFVSDRDGNAEIYAMNADGSGQTRLTNDPANDTDPSWSPDGKKIVFVSDRTAFKDQVYVMSANGSNVKQLTTGPAYDFSPAWSPDGQRIAYSDGHDLLVMDNNGSNSAYVTNNALRNDFPTWSPDGARIAYHRQGVGLYVIDADGSGDTPLVTGGAQFAPAWSPDGSKIAYQAPTSIATDDVFTVRPDGSDVTQVTGSTGHLAGPDWQPIPYTFADLALRLKAKVRACPNCRVIFQLGVHNRGPDAADGVVVTSPLPAGTELVDAEAGQGSCAGLPPGATAVTCSLGRLERHSKTTIILVLVAAGGSTVSDTATVTSDTPDPNPDDNSATVVTTVGR